MQSFITSQSATAENSIMNLNEVSISDIDEMSKDAGTGGYLIRGIKNENYYLSARAFYFWYLIGNDFLQCLDKAINEISEHKELKYCMAKTTARHIHVKANRIHSVTDEKYTDILIDIEQA